jgi:hypothetical protein
MRTTNKIVNGVFAVLLAGSPAQAQKVEIPSGQQYALLEILRLKTLAEELNDAARQGFRLKMTAVEDARVMALMERSATPGDVFEYRTVSTFSPKNGDKEMNKAAAEGFRVVPHTFMVKKGLTIFNVDNVVVMEKDPKATAGYEYQTLVGRFKTATFEKTLATAVSEGWQLLELIYNQILLERPRK